MPLISVFTTSTCIDGLACISPKVDHKVEWKIRGECVDDLIWHIGQHRRNGLARWSIEGITSMFLYNRSLGV